MPIFTTAGAKLFIGMVLQPKTADFVALDFQPQTWIEIAPLEGLGTLGDAAEAVTFTSLSNSRRMKIKGARDAGTVEVVAGLDYSDPGQIALLAAEKSKHNFAFKIVLPDAPEGGTPSERLFIAMVMSATEAYEQADNVMKLNASLGVNSNVVRVNAAAGTP